MNPEGLSPEARARLADYLPNTAEAPMPDVDDFAALTAWRTAQHAAWGEGAVAGEVEHEPAVVAGVECLVAGPADAPLVLHLHAGGFCLGSPGTDVPITARLSKHLRVVSVDYRLAPEAPFPAAIDDAEAVYRALAAEARHPVALCGISAGANLAIQVAWRCPDVPPTGLALLGPHVDFGSGLRRLLPHEAGYLAGYADHEQMALLRSPSVAPIEATDDELAALPPILVQATDSEPMWSSIDRFAAAASRAGVEVTLQVWSGLWHAWHYHRELPEAHDAIDRAVRWLDPTSSISPEDHHSTPSAADQTP